LYILSHIILQLNEEE